MLIKTSTGVIRVHSLFLNIHCVQECTAALAGIIDYLNLMFTKILYLAASLPSHLLYTLCFPRP